METDTALSNLPAISSANKAPAEFAKLAAHLERHLRESSRPPFAQLQPNAPGKRGPLTEAQREIWFASQLGAMASTPYNESIILRLQGSLDVTVLRRALARLVERHEALRMTIAADGTHTFVATTAEMDLPVHRFQELDSRESLAAEAIAEEIERPFDLAAGPLFRAALLRMEPEVHLLTLSVHHIVCDGWSLGLLVRELAELYGADKAGRGPKLAPAPAFSDYAAKETAEQTTPAFLAAQEFWLKQFSDVPPPLELPTDRPRPVSRTFAGDFLSRPLPADVTAAVKKICGERDCTMFTVLFAAFNLLLHRLSGQNDLVVGVPSAAQVMAGLGNMVGHCANLLPIRSRVEPGLRFDEYLTDVRRNMTDALDHWRFPFGRLLQRLNLARDGGRVPLAPVVFNTAGRHGILNFGGLRATIVPSPKRFVNFDLSTTFAMTDAGIVLGCYFSTELFDATTIERWFGHFETLLRGIAANASAAVGDLPLLDERERNQLLVEWNEARLDYRHDACVHSLFEDQAQRTPDAVAIVGADERLTYAELNRRADRIAAWLRGSGVGPETLVGILLERTPNLVASMLGVLKAGGAYVPLDPGYPAERLGFILDDTRMPMVLTQRSLEGRLPAGELKRVFVEEIGNANDAAGDGRAPRAENLAYVIYTSGSTGRPKGVCLMHRGVVALAAWAQSFYKPEELSGVLFSTSACFDVSVFESLVPLCLGGKIILAENILQAGTLAAANEITLVSSVPSAIAQLLRSDQLPASVRTVNVAGEPCPQSLVDALYARPHIARVVDVYGPTETTVYSTGSVRVAGGLATIGRPLPNEQTYILDARLQPVPVGVRGELFIGGDKLARGYLNRPELTRERFIDSPFRAGERLYRTGDGARFLPDGSIEYLGRLDDQVKVRGFRVELGEIEAALREHPAVMESAAVARPDANGLPRLLAYAVTAPGAAVEAQVLREHLTRRLPDYMLPAAIVLLETLPRTTSGKIDRRALPEPDFAHRTASGEPPRTAAEQLLADLWREVLGVGVADVQHNFFELGGHSLLAAQVIARLHATLGIDLTLRDFFACPTIAGLAPAIERALLAQIIAPGEVEAEKPSAMA